MQDLREKEIEGKMSMYQIQSQTQTLLQNEVNKKTVRNQMLTDA
jgi:hypothetical protein